MPFVESLSANEDELAMLEAVEPTFAEPALCWFVPVTAVAGTTHIDATIKAARTELTTLRWCFAIKIPPFSSLCKHIYALFIIKNFNKKYNGF